MLRIYECVVEDHDLFLVALAALICLLSCIVAFQLYGRARANHHISRLGWTAAMGLVAGIGTWATHFIAMLAFQPQAPSAFEPKLTGASLLVAVVVMTCGALVSASSGTSWGRLIGGAMVGAGIGAMHYSGMRAFLIPGHLSWDAAFVTASVTVGVLLGAVSFHVTGEARDSRHLLYGAAILTLGIATLHFIGMAAVGVQFDPIVAIPQQGISKGYLAVGVVAGTTLVMCIGLVSVVLDWRARRGEESRLRDFADAAVEGLVICKDGVIWDANESFCRLAGTELAALRGRGLNSLISPNAREGVEKVENPTEAGLVQPDGSYIPVGVIARDLRSRGQIRTVFAIRDMRAQRNAELRIRFLAHHDALTGLPNRVTFDAALDASLARAKQVGSAVAVFCLGLDHFKGVNELFGHFSGDQVLVQAAERMRGVLAPGDLLARLSGDEFAIIRTLTEESGSAAALAQRLVDAMSWEFEVAGSKISAGLSLGLAVGPADGDQPERLLANANAALDRAKSEGRGRFCCFEAEMDLKVRERHELAADLRGGLGRNELALYYQPQIKVSTRELIGFEALVRWHHPTHGPVPPSVFIPLAEETGQIIAIGEWVLRCACREAAGWSRPLKIAVNLSALQFQQPNVAEMVHAILLETGLAASRLELEITETAFIKDMSRALSILRRLKSLGVRVAMDDFGTGYSSLATLQAFPFDTLKIDRSFVGKVESHPQASSIVRAVLGLGRSLGMTVVAEGVETAAQAKFLSEEACDEVQGYLFGKPQPIEQFVEVLHPKAVSARLREVA